ncbi:hypothetical protein [Aminivibrio sp.]|jgi:hypothetical protein|uniref:hypothetical protein n=1 Tax=Aminivibrio sp. TaxID=1872489 RepID=UPI00345E488D
MKNESKYPKLLKVLASVLEKLTDEEMDALLAGELKLVTEAKAKRKETKAKTAPAVVDESFLKSAAEQLSFCNSREDGQKILTAMKLKKADLLQIAESNMITARKGDSLKTIKDAIIEHFIGSRLRGDAFKTIDLRSEQEKL